MLIRDLVAEGGLCFTLGSLRIHESAATRYARSTEGARCLRALQLDDALLQLPLRGHSSRY